MRELALFAGGGGGILGGVLLGWRTVCAVEIDPYARKVLLARQKDGILPAFPIWDDIRTFAGHTWRGSVDVVSGGFPCQDISCAGKGKGLEGERSGLWSEMARVISEVEPRYVFVENSPMLTGRGLDRVLMDLAKLGFNARWGVLGADDAGAPHKRKRIWIVAQSSSTRAWNNNRTPGDSQRGTSRGKLSPLRQRDGADGSAWIDSASEGKGVMAHATKQHGSIDRQKALEPGWGGKTMANAMQQQRNGRGHRLSWWEREPEEALQDAWGGRREKDGVSISESKLGRVANGVANRVDRLRTIGNGQVSRVAQLAWETLK